MRLKLLILLFTLLHGKFVIMLRIEKVAVKALETFAKQQPMSSFQDNLKELINLTNQLTITDVFLTKDFVNQPDAESETDPIGYMKIFQDEHITITVFILRQFSRIPFHDHPLMHGIMKVLFGKVKLTSYSLEDTCSIKQRYCDASVYSPVDYYDTNDIVTMYETPHIPAIAHDPVIVSEHDPASLFTPFIKNIHQVEAIEGPATFLDILAPPYDTAQRKCTYFKVTENVARKPLLYVSHFPPAYFTEDIPFTGPNLYDTLRNITANYHRTEKPKIDD